MSTFSAKRPPDDFFKIQFFEELGNIFPLQFLSAIVTLYISISFRHVGIPFKKTLSSSELTIDCSQGTGTSSSFSRARQSQAFEVFIHCLELNVHFPPISCSLRFSLNERKKKTAAEWSFSLVYWFLFLDVLYLVNVDLHMSMRQDCHSTSYSVVRFLSFFFLLSGDLFISS